MRYRFEIHEKAIGKERPRYSAKTHRMYTPTRTSTFEEKVKSAFLEKYNIEIAPTEKQTAMNKAFQQYKMTMAIVTTAGVQQTKEIEFDMSDCITISLERNRETTKQRRAREKRELRKEMEEIEL